MSPAETPGRSAYRRLCAEEESVPLFARDWWLDAVCTGRESWDAAVVTEGGRAVAALPYSRVAKWGFVALTQPELCPALGPWHAASDTKPVNALARIKAHSHALLEQLPPYDQFTQHFHPALAWWAPYHWKGFTQTTRYTYRLEGRLPEAELWGGLHETARREIRKAQGRSGLTVSSASGIDELWPLFCATFERQGQVAPIDYQALRRLEVACGERGCRQTLIASDGQGRRHAAVFIVWDKSFTYYLLGGSDLELRTSGALSLCLWEAIRQARDRGSVFDFEGSMIEPIDKFFRGFGATPTPYSTVRHSPSKLLMTRDFLTAMFARR